MSFKYLKSWLIILKILEKIRKLQILGKIFLNNNHYNKLENIEYKYNNKGLFKSKYFKDLTQFIFWYCKVIC